MKLFVINGKEVTGVVKWILSIILLPFVLIILILTIPIIIICIPIVIIILIIVGTSECIKGFKRGIRKRK